MKLTLNQQHVVESLFVNYINEKEQVLVSPTGSGKTFMIFNWIKRVKEYHESEKDKKVFLFLNHYQRLN